VDAHLAVAALITGLFLKLRLTRDRQKMGVLSAIGFGIGEIVGQVRGKTVLAVVVGTSLGVAFSATAGESIVGAFIAMAGLGIADLTFIPNAWFVYAAYPLLLIVAGYLGAVALTARLRKADRSLWLRG
jgi:putative ABC transport system permease protein